MSLQKHFFLSFSVFCLLSTLTHGQNITGFDYGRFFNEDNFGLPYKVNFSDNEKTFLTKLDPTTLEKIRKIAEAVFTKNTSGTENGFNVPTKSESVPTTQVQSTQQTPANSLSRFLNSVIKPVSQSRPINIPPAYSGLSGLTDSELVSNPNFNPANAPQDSPIPYTPMNREDVANFSKLPEAPSGNCTNFGIKGDSNKIIDQVKVDTNCLCIAFGGQLKVVSGFRNGDPRNHGKGLAIDIEENNYKNKQKDAMLITAFIALGYNVGSYHPNFGSFHVDRESSHKCGATTPYICWKTWSGVAHTDYSGSNSRNYYQMVQDSLNIIGKPAISSKQFRGTYGSPSKKEMMERAQAVILKSGNEALKKCMSAAHE